MSQISKPVISRGYSNPYHPARYRQKAAYLFNEASGAVLRDCSPYRLDSAIANGAVWDGDRTLKFDGVDDIATAAVVAGSQLDIRSFITIACRFKINGAPAGAGTKTYHELAAQGNNVSGGAVQWQLWVNEASRFLLFTGNSAVIQPFTSGLSLVNGTWYFAHFTYDGANVRFYLDGNLRATFAQTGTLGASVGTFEIGGESGGNMQFNGNMDFLAVYDRPLSQTEISQQVADPFEPFAFVPGEEPVSVAASTPAGTEVPGKITRETRIDLLRTVA